MVDIGERHTETAQPSAEKDEPPLVVDLKKLYAFEPEDLAVELSGTYYSNVSYMQIAPRDVIIDFLEMPGIKKDGKVKISGIRIYMSHTAALRMVESLGALLLNNVNIIERFELSKPNEVKLSTEISRLSEKEQA
jgi:hypothetical protein